MSFPNNKFDIAIVGGGIVGLASAYKIQTAFPDLKLLLLEKEKMLASHQTGNNSGVMHSGIYYKPGSLRAKNCVAGRRELVAFAKKYRIAHDVCGKVIAAVTDDEVKRLAGIFNRGIENNIEGIEIIDRKKLLEIEPCCGGQKAIWVPCTGIIDFKGVTNKLAEIILNIQPKSEIKTGTEVSGTLKNTNHTVLVTNRGKFYANKVIYCAGLQSDRLARQDNISSKIKIVGFRGDYYELTPQAQNKVKNLIYPVPDPAFPFLGVHYTRMTHGGVECGPNAVVTFKREGYAKTDFSRRDTWEALSYKGTWKLFRKHWRFGLNEYKRAFSKSVFLKTAQHLLPSITENDLIEGRSGVRAMALAPDGEIIDDFNIEYNNNAIHVLNAPSPAATAALAIGEEVKRIALERFQLNSKTKETAN